MASDSGDIERLESVLAKETRKPRKFGGAWLMFCSILGFLLVLFYTWSAGFRPVGPQFHRGIYVLITFVLVFLHYPMRGSSEAQPKPSFIDLFLATISAVTVLYWIVEFPTLNQRMGAETDLDAAVGIVGVLISLEVARRVLGWALPLVGIAMLGYAYFGIYMPDIIQHGGFSIKEIAVELFISTNGVFGIMANVLATYVILFIFFGAFLHKSGAGKFFLDFPMALAGRSVGGAAKVSVIASALFGSISGSAIANTVSTGTFTIPLMKKAGFKPHVAGAIEPAASIGGMFLPPIMGAGGFIMAELLEKPYSYIMGVALFPALVYFFAIFMMIHFEAKKTGIVPNPGTDLPKASEVFRNGWYKILPLAIITVLMILGRSPGYAAVWAILSCILISYATPETRMGPKEIWQAMVEGANQTLVIGATVGVIGIIVGTIELSGIGLQLSNLVMILAEQASGIFIPKILAAVLLIALASLILGMGVPVTAAYLVTAVLVAPSLTEMGVSLVAAHMIVYWVSQDSNITPPVCVAAYAGAAIAKADPWKTGWTAFKYAKMLYVMPILFAYVPAILLDDSVINILIAFTSCLLGSITFAAVTQGYFARQTNLLQWLALLPITVLLFWPTLLTTAVGLAAAVILVVWQQRTQRIHG